MSEADHPRHLPTLPEAHVLADGRLALGRFSGASDEVRWGYPTGWLDGQRLRALGRKRWFQLTALSPERIVVVRILDQGLVGSGFVWVADPRTGRTELEQRLPGVPLANLAVGPVAGRGAHAFVSLPNAKIIVRRDGESTAWALNVQLPGHAISLTFDTRKAPAPLSSIDALRPDSTAPEATRGVLIQRHIGLEVRGTVRFRSEVSPLERNATGIVEYGNGFVLTPDHPVPNVVNVSNVSSHPNDPNDKNSENDFGHAAWSSALIAPVAQVAQVASSDGDHLALPAAPWLALTDLGDGGAFTWRDDSPIELAGPPTFTRPSPANSHEPWRIRSASLDLSFQPRCIALEATQAPGFLTRPRPLAPIANALEMRHALIAGLFEGTVFGAEGQQRIRALGLCEARAFGPA